MEMPFNAHRHPENVPADHPGGGDMFGIPRQPDFRRRVHPFRDRVEDRSAFGIPDAVVAIFSFEFLHLKTAHFGKGHILIGQKKFDTVAHDA